jgi:hypothetical protein
MHALQGVITTSIMAFMKSANDFFDWRLRFGKKSDERSQERSRLRPCDHPGCELEGEHRAPQSRDRLDSYYWFCLDHVRAYNAKWDYYAGMSSQQIENEVRRDTTWQRPTWRLGVNGGSAHAAHKLRDAFGVFDQDDIGDPISRHPQRRPPEEMQALRNLGLEDPLTIADLKSRYKELVKQHHPDANGGDRLSEERFKTINTAYRTLLATFDQTT